MRTLHSTGVLLVLLVFGLFLVCPAEDSPSTVYDESETQPYEASLPNSSLVAQAATTTQTMFSEAQAPRSALRIQINPFPPSDVAISRARHFTGARILLARICAFLF